MCRIGPRAEGGPRDRGHRGEGRSQPPVASHRGEPREVRQVALLHELAGQPRILAVEANDDEAPDERAGQLTAANEMPQGAKRPHEHRGDRDDYRGEEDEKRGEERKSSARSDVCVGWRRHSQERDDGQAEDETNGA